jgi:hypothetical protein
VESSGQLTLQDGTCFETKSYASVKADHFRLLDGESSFVSATIPPPPRLVDAAACPSFRSRVDHPLRRLMNCVHIHKQTWRHSGTIGGKGAAASRDLICHGHVRHWHISSGTNSHATIEGRTNHAPSRGLAHAGRVIDHLDQVTMATVVRRHQRRYCFDGLRERPLCLCLSALMSELCVGHARVESGTEAENAWLAIGAIVLSPAFGTGQEGDARVIHDANFHMRTSPSARLQYHTVRPRTFCSDDDSQSRRSPAAPHRSCTHDRTYSDIRAIVTRDAALEDRQCSTVAKMGLSGGRVEFVCVCYPRQREMRPSESQQHRVEVYMPTDEYRGRRSKLLPAC